MATQRSNGNIRITVGLFLLMYGVGRQALYSSALAWSIVSMLVGALVLTSGMIAFSASAFPNDGEG